MVKVFLARFQQGHRTVSYPDTPPTLPDRFRGAPSLAPEKCHDGCRSCVDACPTGAIDTDKDGLRLDMGRCLFCADCVSACPAGAIIFTAEHRLAARSRSDLVVHRSFETKRKALDERLRRLFGRSLKLRVVSAGGCNGCELDVNVLTTIVFDLGRFGIQIVASPRHADGLLVTGPVTRNMALALQKTYEAMPAPKVVIAVGACAIAGGPYIGHPEAHDGADALLPVDLYVPGCPPSPYTILDGLLGLIGRLEDAGRSSGSSLVLVD
ncbi:MAG TPA: NADH-quinone oxidoreductase subunit NuoB [Polyangiaceae bacterium]|nr:NADH-quinone oxidoreductase subunit NuoB [Polyangiaceae bacterium]